MTAPFSLCERLRVYPQHREAGAMPVVCMIDGISHIVGNARTDFGAVTLARCYRPDANGVRRMSLAINGEIARNFFMVL